MSNIAIFPAARPIPGTAAIKHELHSGVSVILKKEPVHCSKGCAVRSWLCKLEESNRQCPKKDSSSYHSEYPALVDWEWGLPVQVSTNNYWQNISLTVHLEENVFKHLLWSLVLFPKDELFPKARKQLFSPVKIFFIGGDALVQNLRQRWCSLSKDALVRFWYCYVSDSATATLHLNTWGSQRSNLSSDNYTTQWTWPQSTNWQ